MATESREERRLIRQRGAGARELTGANFGFTFGSVVPSIPPPPPAQRLVSPQKRTSPRKHQNKVESVDGASNARRDVHPTANVGRILAHENTKELLGKEREVQEAAGQHVTNQFLVRGGVIQDDVEAPKNDRIQQPTQVQNIDDKLDTSRNPGLTTTSSTPAPNKAHTTGRRRGATAAQISGDNELLTKSDRLIPSSMLARRTAGQVLEDITNIPCLGAALTSATTVLKRNRGRPAKCTVERTQAVRTATKATNKELMAEVAPEASSVNGQAVDHDMESEPVVNPSKAQPHEAGRAVRQHDCKTTDHISRGRDMADQTEPSTRQIVASATAKKIPTTTTKNNDHAPLAIQGITRVAATNVNSDSRITNEERERDGSRVDKKPDLPTLSGTTKEPDLITSVKTVSQPKRRGRPPRAVITNTEESTAALALPSITHARRRGRPPKVMEETTNIITSSAVDDHDAQAEQVESKEKEQHKNPRKHAKVVQGDEPIIPDVLLERKFTAPTPVVVTEEPGAYTNIVELSARVAANTQKQRTRRPQQDLHKGSGSTERIADDDVVEDRAIDTALEREKTTNEVNIARGRAQRKKRSASKAVSTKDTAEGHVQAQAQAIVPELEKNPPLDRRRRLRRVRALPNTGTEERALDQEPTHESTHLNKSQSKDDVNLPVLQPSAERLVSEPAKRGRRAKIPKSFERDVTEPASEPPQIALQLAEGVLEAEITYEPTEVNVKPTRKSRKAKTMVHHDDEIAFEPEEQVAAEPNVDDHLGLLAETKLLPQSRAKAVARHTVRTRRIPIAVESCFTEVRPATAENYALPSASPSQAAQPLQHRASNLPSPSKQRQAQHPKEEQAQPPKIERKPSRAFPVFITTRQGKSAAVARGLVGMGMMGEWQKEDWFEPRLPEKLMR